VSLIILVSVVLLPIVPAYLLFKALPSSAIVSGPLQGLNINLGGAFAGYFAVVVLVISTHNIVFPPPPPPLPPAYQVWEISGQVTDQDGNAIEPLDIKDIALSPPIFQSSPGGNFTLTFATMPAPGGGMKYPILTVSHPNFQVMTIPLEPSALKELATTLKVDRDDATREIKIRQISLRSIPQPYHPSTPPPQQIPYSAVTSLEKHQ
jgi:hypothetical protein